MKAKPPERQTKEKEGVSLGQLLHKYTGTQTLPTA